MRRAERGEAPRGSEGPKRSVARSSPTRPDAARPNAEGGRRSGIPEGHPRKIQTLTSLPEFAADLWQVHLKEGSDEYRDPVEFRLKGPLRRQAHRAGRDR